MKPIRFPEQNITYAENQPEYQPLPAFKNASAQGEVISCWQLSFRERLRILWTGKLWVSLMSFNNPLTPSFFTTKRSDVLAKPQEVARLKPKDEIFPAANSHDMKDDDL